jgi:hypothetical protein
MCPTKLAEEIDRCKANAEIDSAFYNNHNKQIVIVARNDAAAEFLREVWPLNAFMAGVKVTEKKESS